MSENIESQDASDLETQESSQISQNPNQIVNTLNRQFQELEQKVFEIQINQILEQIMTINNQLLLQKQFLDHFLNFLQIQQSQVLFQDVTNYQQCIQIIDANYLQKKQEFETEFYQRMKVYDELTQKVNLNELEKIMKILKSKQKSIYISKDIQECHCHHVHVLMDHQHQNHEHNGHDENKLQQEEEQVNKEEQQIPEQEQIQDNAQNKENNQKEEVEQQIEENKSEQTAQNEVNIQQNQEQEIANFQSIEDEQQMLYQQTQELFDQYNQIQSQRQLLAEQKLKAEQALQKQKQMEQKIIEIQQRQQQLIHALNNKDIQEEQTQDEQTQTQETDVELKQQQIDVEQYNIVLDQQQLEQVQEKSDDDQVQNQQELQEQGQQDEQAQVELDDATNQGENQLQTEVELREQIIKSREQIQRLMQQRDDLIQMKEQLSQKQQDLEQQKQFLLERLEVSQNQAEQGQMIVKEQKKETQTEEEEQKFQNISFLDIFNVMQFKNLDSLQKYNDQNKSIVFKLHRNYTVEIKGDDIEPDKPLNEDSLLIKIPPFILTHQILQYLSAFEIFKTRSVCAWWRDQIKQIWPNVFKREMYEQMSSNNLKKNIFRSSLLLKLKYKFAERLNNILRAMFELVNWEELDNQITNPYQNEEQKEQNIQIKKCVVTILILLNKIQNIQYLYQIDDNVVVEQNAQDVRQLLNEFLSFEQFSPLSISQMKTINQSLLQSPEFELQNIQPSENKNLLYLTIITNQIYYYGFLKNIIKAESISIEKQSKEFNILSERLNYNSNFLEGAHKIIMRTQTDSNDDEDEVEVEQQDEEKPLAEAQQFLKSLVNLEETGEPDIVIKKHRTITRIFIDVNTKLDILVSSMHQSKEQ